MVKKLKSIRKANDFISFTIGDVQFLNKMEFFGEEKLVDSFLKLIKPMKPKVFSV